MEEDQVDNDKLLTTDIETESNPYIDKVVTIQDTIALKNFGLNINKGEFVCIIGDVGSGKSSLLSSLIGDLLYINNATKERVGQSDIKDEDT